MVHPSRKDQRYVQNLNQLVHGSEWPRSVMSVRCEKQWTAEEIRSGSLMQCGGLKESEALQKEESGDCSPGTTQKSAF